MVLSAWDLLGGYNGIIHAIAAHRVGPELIRAGANGNGQRLHFQSGNSQVDHEHRGPDSADSRHGTPRDFRRAGRSSPGIHLNRAITSSIAAGIASQHP